MISKSKWIEVWGNRKMYETLYKQRPAYTNNEIVNLFNEKMKNESILEEELANRYDTEVDTIKYMRSTKCRYSYPMLKIASDFLEINYEDLTSILVDDEDFSPRADTEEETGEFFGFLNYIFNEMIRQERLSK